VHTEKRTESFFRTINLAVEIRDQIFSMEASNDFNGKSDFCVNNRLGSVCSCSHAEVKGEQQKQQKKKFSSNFVFTMEIMYLCASRLSQFFCLFVCLFAERRNLTELSLLALDSSNYGEDNYFVEHLSLAAVSTRLPRRCVLTRKFMCEENGVSDGRHFVNWPSLLSSLRVFRLTYSLK
jgi:hypothetical protein